MYYYVRRSSTVAHPVESVRCGEGSVQVRPRGGRCASHVRGPPTKGVQMAVGTLATLFGIVFLLVGVLGFFGSPPPPDALPLQMEHGHGLALGLFPVNTVHNVVHLLFGALGLAA